MKVDMKVYMVHHGHGFGKHNTEGERVMEFAIANDLVVVNSYFVKKDNHLITYQSGGCSSQVDYILFKKRDFKLVKDVKVIPGEECAAQHRILVCDLKVMFSKPTKQSFVPRRQVWKLKEPASKDTFVAALDKNLAGGVGNTVDDIWDNLKSGRLNET